MHMRSLAGCLAIGLLLGCVPSTVGADPTYWQDIRPILRKHCTVCHSEKNLKEVEVSGGVALDTYEAVRSNKKGPMIRVGESSNSRVIKLMRSENELRRMPQGAPSLPKETIDLVSRWIDSGAKEGTKVDTSTETVSSVPARLRKLDVTFPTSLIPPKGALGPMAPARLELALKVGPLSPVAAVTFSPDSKLLASGAYGRVTVWDLGAGRPVKVLTSVLGAVNDLRFSADGKLLAVGGGQPSAKGDLRLYQTSDWKLLTTLPGHEDIVSSIAFHPDGKHLASASFDKTVRIWDLATHKLVRTLAGHSDFVYATAFGPDGKWIVSASKDRSVKMVETATGKSLLTFSGLDQDIMAVTVSPDGKQVISSGFEPGLYCWNTQTGERIRVQGGHGVAVHELGFSKDGKLIVSAGADRTVRLWNGTTGAPVQTLTVGSIVYAAAISPDGKRVAAGSFDGLVRVWDVATVRHLVTLLSLPPEGDNPAWLALTPEGFVTGSEPLLAQGQWRMSGQAVGPEPVWKVVRQPEMVARAARGEAVTSPAFGK